MNIVNAIAVLVIAVILVAAVVVVLRWLIFWALSAIVWWVRR